MDKDIIKRIKSLLLLFFIAFSSLFIQFGNYFIANNTEYSNDSTNKLDKIYSSNGDLKSIQLLQNPTFDLPIEPWYSSKSGDTSHINATTSDDCVNFDINAEQRTFSYVANPPNGSDFTIIPDPYGPIIPDNVGMDSQGCYIAHTWNESENSPDQMVSVHWSNNITMPVNMSNYEITAASLKTMINATLHANNGALGGIECLSDPVEFGMVYDYAHFYVIISNFDKSINYNVIDYTLNDLGNDSAGTYDFLTNTYLIAEPENNLTIKLSNALNFNDYNFIITLGIDIYCEDNFATVNDTDIWDELRFKFFNLTFTYKNKISQPTKLSWNQDLKDSLKDIKTNYKKINSALLSFKYRINQLWPASSYPNCRFRISINNNYHTDYINLSNMTINFQETTFDISTLIVYDDDINLTIELSILDELLLNNSYKISLDYAYLNITYSHFKPIFIDGEATGVDAHNWSWAANQTWCTFKNGTYFIENLIIDGYGESCIEIRNSNVNLVINNCTLYNSTENEKAGVELINVNNTIISNNECFLSHYGIFLNSTGLAKNYNNVIIKNTLSDNVGAILIKSSNFCHILNNNITKINGINGTNGNDGSTGNDGGDGEDGHACYGIYNNGNYSIIKNNLIFNLSGGNGGRGGNGGDISSGQAGTGGIGGEGGSCYGIYSNGNHNIVKYNNLSNINGGSGGNGGDGGVGNPYGGNGGGGGRGGDCYGIYNLGLNCCITINDFFSINSGKGGDGGNRGGIIPGYYGYGQLGGFSHGIYNNGNDCVIRDNKFNNIIAGNGGSSGGVDLSIKQGGDGPGGYSFGVRCIGNDCLL